MLLLGSKPTSKNFRWTAIPDCGPVPGRGAPSVPCTYVPACSRSMPFSLNRATTVHVLPPCMAGRAITSLAHSPGAWSKRPGGQASTRSELKPVRTRAKCCGAHTAAAALRLWTCRLHDPPSAASLGSPCCPRSAQGRWHQTHPAPSARRALPWLHPESPPACAHSVGGAAQPPQGPIPRRNGCMGRAEVERPPQRQNRQHWWRQRHWRR